MVLGVVLSVVAVLRGLSLFGGNFAEEEFGAALFGLGMLLLAALPPALVAFFAWRLRRKAATLAPVGLGVRVGALLSFTAAVVALYLSTLFNEAVWLDAQAGLSYLFLPLLTLAVGAVSAICGGIIGGFIMRLRAR